MEQQKEQLQSCSKMYTAWPKSSWAIFLRCQQINVQTQVLRSFSAFAVDAFLSLSARQNCPKGAVTHLWQGPRLAKVRAGSSLEQLLSPLHTLSQQPTMAQLLGKLTGKTAFYFARFIRWCPLWEWACLAKLCPIRGLGQKFFFWKELLIQYRYCKSRNINQFRKKKKKKLYMLMIKTINTDHIN